MKNLLALNKYLLRYKWRLLLGALFVFASNYFAVLIPQQIRKALDFVQETLRASDSLSSSNLTSVLIIFTMTVIGFSILKGIAMYFTRQTIIVMSRLIEYDLRKDIYDHMQKLDTAFYKISRTGDLMSRISEDVNKVRMYVGPSLLYGINLIGLFTLTIIAMLNVSVKLTFYTLLPLPVLSISIYFVSRLINKRSAIIQKQLGVLTSNAQEAFSGIRVLKSYVKEDQFSTYFAQESETFKHKSIDLARVNALFFPLMILLVSISTLLVVYMGGLEVVAGRLTGGNIAEFIIYVNMLTWPVTSIGWIASLIQQAEASQKRINELMQQTSSLTNGDIIADDLQGKIEFKNVSFTYKDTDIEALRDISFTLDKGEKLAILGKTASGKSTVAELILRMYDVMDGQILVDGQDIQHYDMQSLRSHMGYVPQDVFLFSDTVENNIAFGTTIRPELGECQKYASYAAIHDEIMELPDGYQTRVGERGVNLSGGQKQRISIARALIKKPKFLILDDCLSAVDTDTEKQILDHLSHELSHSTTIMVTNRIQGITGFDKIMVLEDGRVIQFGTHDQLQDQEGYYADIIRRQQSTSNL